MKNQKLAILTITSICWLAIFGCAPSDSGGSSGGTTLTGPIADLQGTWLTSCRAYDDTYFAITKAQVSGTGIVQTTHFYTNSGCTVEAYKLNYILVDLDVGESITFTSGRTGYRYSFSQQTLELTSLNDIVTQVSNTQKASANCACVQGRAKRYLQPLAAAMDYRRSLDLDRPMKLERASIRFLLRAEARWVGHKIKVQRT